MNDPWRQLLDAALDSVGVSGAAGGFFRWVAIKPRKWTELLISVTAGFISAIYLLDIVRPLVAPFTEAAVTDRLAGFIAGVLGISISGFIVDAFSVWKKLKGEEDKKKNE